MSTLGAFLTNKLETWVEVDEVKGFEVKVAYLSREELNKIRDATTTNKFNRATRQPEPVTNDELFVELFVKATVVDWKGLTLEKAAKLIPVSFNEDTDLSTDVPYTEDEALLLVKESPVFDAWLNDVAFDLSRFPSKKSKQKPRPVKKVS